MWIISSGERYNLRKGVLKKFALSHIDELTRKLPSIHYWLLYEIDVDETGEREISIGDFELALKSAYIKEQEMCIDGLLTENRNLESRLDGEYLGENSGMANGGKKS